MFKNYFKIAVRNLFKNKLYSFINIFGLSIGIAMALLIMPYVQHETSFETWIPDSENIYRVNRQWKKDADRGSAITPGPLAPTLVEELPGVVASTRIYDLGESLLSTDQKSLYFEKVVYVDSLFFNTIPFYFKYGTRESSLMDITSAVLTKQAAEKIFDEENPVGKTFKLNGEEEYVVKGVLASPKGNTHIQHEIYLMSNQYSPYWTGNNVVSYVRLLPNVNTADLDEKISAIADNYIKKEYATFGETPRSLPLWKLQSLETIHLNSKHLGYSSIQSGDKKRISIFTFLAIIILGIACINYMNLSTARATKRALEVGIRKVSGATRMQTVSQFLIEAVLQSSIALFIAILLAEMALPFFNEITGRDLSVINMFNGILPLGLISIVFLVGILAGSYPSIFLSRFTPVDTLKGALLKGKSGSRMRKGLVVTQFTMTIALIILVTFVFRQVNHMLNQDLGFNKDQIVVISCNTDAGIENVTKFKDQITQIPGVISITQAGRLPGEFTPNYGVRFPETEEGEYINTTFVDADYAETMGVELVEGRFFDASISSDTVTAFIVNQQLVKDYNLENPIGAKIKFSFDENFGEIIGVIKDFHYEGLESTLSPLLLSSRKDMDWINKNAIKISGANVSETISGIEAFWKNIEPEHPVRYTFLDEDFAAQYDDHRRFGKTIGYATFLSILIAVMGLFGLASYTAEQRKKELGIRKVLGASINSLMNLLVKDFVKLVLIAGLLAFPIGYFLSNNWLKDFAYQTSMSITPFLVSILSAIAIAVVTVGLQAYKASIANPVDSIKSE